MCKTRRPWEVPCRHVLRSPRFLGACGDLVLREGRSELITKSTFSFLSDAVVIRSGWKGELEDSGKKAHGVARREKFVFTWQQDKSGTCRPHDCRRIMEE